MRANGTMLYSFDAFSGKMEWAFPGTSLTPVTFTIPNRDAIAAIDDLSYPAIHNGYKQKIGDAAAIARNTETGKPATAQDKRDAMQAVVDRLNNGEWNAVKTGGKPKMVNRAILAMVIAAVKGKDVTKISKWVETKTAEQVQDLANSVDFAEAYILQMSKQRPMAVLDEEVLDELDDL
jgi:hypothetical protein